VHIELPFADLAVQQLGADLAQRAADFGAGVFPLGQVMLLIA